MPRMITFTEAQRFGFTFPGARMWISKETMPKIAQDAALQTTPNVAVPVEFTAYIDPEVIEILTAPRNARELFSETKKGDWTTSYDKFRVSELVGKTEPYSDFSHTASSDVNSEWMSRKQYRFQTTSKYGQLEMALSTEAKINLASEKQKAAATRIDIDANKFYLLGVENQDIYGILNDPNLPSAITAKEKDGSTVWADKDTKGIYDDILELFRQLATQSKGLITHRSALKLCMSPEMSTYLGSATDFNVSVQKMLDTYFTNLTVVTLPELSSLDGDQTVFMIAPSVAGQKSATLAYGEKMRGFPAVQFLSSWKQKYMATTYGGIVYQPFAFASMTGVA